MTGREKFELARKIVESRKESSENQEQFEEVITKYIWECFLEMSESTVKEMTVTVRNRN